MPFSMPQGVEEQCHRGSLAPGTAEGSDHLPRLVCRKFPFCLAANLGVCVIAAQSPLMPTPVLFKNVFFLHFPQYRGLDPEPPLLLSSTHSPLSVLWCQDVDGKLVCRGAFLFTHVPSPSVPYLPTPAGLLPKSQRVLSRWRDTTPANIKLKPKVNLSLP